MQSVLLPKLKVRFFRTEEAREPDLWEVRVRLENRIARVLFTVINDVAVLVHGFIKQGQKTPQDDLKLAARRARLISQAER
jgi:phage-related protein